LTLDARCWYTEGGDAEAGWLVIPLKDQLNAILNAPIPFALVCVGAVAAAWGMMRWLYKERMEKTKDLYELSRKEIEIKTGIAARIEDELKEEIENLKKGLDESKRSPEIDSLTEKVSALQIKMSELAQANAAISNAVSRTSTPWLDTGSGLESARMGLGRGMPDPKLWSKRR
jgi:hypothetical protein